MTHDDQDLDSSGPQLGPLHALFQPWRPCLSPTPGPSIPHLSSTGVPPYLMGLGTSNSDPVSWTQGDEMVGATFEHDTSRNMKQETRRGPNGLTLFWTIKLHHLNTSWIGTRR